MADESRVHPSGNQAKPAGPHRPAPTNSSQDTQTQLLSLLSNKQQYAWSWLRIWEQVTTNVLTVVIIGGAGVLATFLIQRVFNFIVIPTHWLIVAAIAAIGIMLTVLVIALVVYLYMRKHPIAIALGLLALLATQSIEKDGAKVLTDVFSRSARAENPAQPTPHSADPKSTT